MIEYPLDLRDLAGNPLSFADLKAGMRVTTGMKRVDPRTRQASEQLRTFLVVTELDGSLSLRLSGSGV